MSTQLEAFPKTNLEILEGLRAYHVAQLDKARTALANLADHEKIARAYEKAEEKLAAARQLVGEIDAALERERERESLPGDEEPPVVDPITGEVTTSDCAAQHSGPAECEDCTSGDDDCGGYVKMDAGVHPEHTRPCPACHGDGRLPDKTGGGHHRCKNCGGTGRTTMTGSVVPVVVVLYPGDDEPHVTEVGPFTRYSELVADYLGTLGPVEEMSTSIDDFQVIGEDDGLPRDLKMDIPADDYGKRLIVEAAG